MNVQYLNIWSPRLSVTFENKRFLIERRRKAFSETLTTANFFSNMPYSHSRFLKPRPTYYTKEFLLCHCSVQTPALGRNLKHLSGTRACVCIRERQCRRQSKTFLNA